MSLRRWLHAHLVYPAVVAARGEGTVFSQLRELRLIERSSTESLHYRQAFRLAAILNYAAARSPYYRARWPAGRHVTPEEARDRLADLPTLEKRELQQSQDELLARPRVRRVTRKITGGSTGEPVTVVKNRTATAREMAASWLGYGWFGVRMGDRAARFWGSPASLKRRLRFAAADLAMHRVRFSAFAFDENDLERYWERCKTFRPDYFYGYVSMLEAFASFVRRRGYDGKSLGLKSVVTTSEVLSPPQRRLIENAFGAPVQNEYGSGEVGPIAYECEEGSLHVMSENLVLEVLRPDGAPAVVGEAGELVVTDLNNRAMPLVRYRLGDYGVPGVPCECGRGFPVLEKVWGRAYDFVQRPDGRRYHGEFFMYLFEDLRAEGLCVDQFQVVQSGPTTLEILVVSPSASSSGVEDCVRGHVRRKLEGMELTVRRVQAISRLPSGKMQVIRNDWLRRGPGKGRPDIPQSTGLPVEG
jgi:phenylacetate-CoA ligase